MSIITKIKNNRAIFLNMSASVILHAVIFFILSVVLYFSDDQDALRSQYIQIETKTSDNNPEIIEQEKTELPEEPIKKQETEKQQPAEPSAISLESEIDTSGLKNIYKESTLNVRIKYPSGWTFIDQNVKNKLDGVTFWASGGAYDPPPYIHLEVKEKYLFNPSRYKFKEELDEYTAYFNEPKELSGQVSQEIYLVTDTDEDYSIKLIMEGEEEFKSFQPVFFAMLKTFKFGKSLF